MILLFSFIGGVLGGAFGPVGSIAGAVLAAVLVQAITGDGDELSSWDEEGIELSDYSPFESTGDDFDINPATGLPMLNGGIGGFDVGGNPYGHDLSDGPELGGSISTDIFSDDMNFYS